MKKSRYNESQIIQVLNEVEGRRMIKDVCREYGISEATGETKTLLKKIVRSMLFLILRIFLRSLNSNPYFSEILNIREKDCISRMLPEMFGLDSDKN
jgi:hypothetical protein